MCHTNGESVQDVTALEYACIEPLFLAQPKRMRGWAENVVCQPMDATLSFCMAGTTVSPQQCARTLHESVCGCVTSWLGGQR